MNLLRTSYSYIERSYQYVYETTNRFYASQLSGAASIIANALLNFSRLKKTTVFLKQNIKNASLNLELQRKIVCLLKVTCFVSTATVGTVIWYYQGKGSIISWYNPYSPSFQALDENASTLSHMSLVGLNTMNSVVQNISFYISAHKFMSHQIKTWFLYDLSPDFKELNSQSLSDIKFLKKVRNVTKITDEVLIVINSNLTIKPIEQCISSTINALCIQELSKNARSILHNLTQRFCGFISRSASC